MPYTIVPYKDGYKVCKKNNLKKCFSKNPLSEEKAKKQKIAINISEHKEGGLKPITARVGGKVLLKKKIVDQYFPSPSSYSTYVEPFVGFGSIYFYKNKDDHKEVINDIDPDVSILFKGLQNHSAKQLSEELNGNYSKEDFEDIKNSNPTDAYHRFLKTYLLYKLSYFGRGLSYGKPRISSTFEGYQERLKGVDIYSTDYKEIVKKYNKPSTFFYLDPPIVASTSSYHFPGIDIPDLVKVLRSIKGKFLLSLANTHIKKELFKGFKIVTIPTKYVGEKTIGGQSKKVNEYLIMNYESSRSGGMKILNSDIIIPKKEFIKEHKELVDFFSKQAKEQGKELKKVGGNTKTVELLIKAGMTEERMNEINTKIYNMRQAKVIDKEMYDYAIEIGKELKRYLDLTKSKYGDKIEGFATVTHYITQILDTKSSASAKTGTDKLAAVKYVTTMTVGGKMCRGCMGRCGGSMVKFHKQLAEVGLDHEKYMKLASQLAEATGYDPSKLSMSEDENHKLVYHSPDGDRYFGKVDYSDYIIWSWMEKNGEVEKGTADKRRNAYRARATNIKGNWKKDKYSPNNLAINILW